VKSPEGYQKIWRNDLKGFGFTLGCSLFTCPSSISEIPHLIVGIRQHVISVNMETGEIEWSFSLGMMSCFATMTFCRNMLIVGDMGHLWGLNPDDGTKIFHDNMKGLGYHEITFSDTDQNACTLLIAIEEARRKNRSMAVVH